MGASPSCECVWTTGDLLRIGLGYGTNNDNENVLEQRFLWPSFRSTPTYDNLKRLIDETECSNCGESKARLLRQDLETGREGFLARLSSRQQRWFTGEKGDVPLLHHLQ